jgi:transposase-like protein
MNNRPLRDVPAKSWRHPKHLPYPTKPIDCGSGFAVHPYIRVRGQWRYLYRAIDRDGALVDVMLSEHRDLAAARAFFRSAKTVTGVTPDRVTTDGHDAYPRAIRPELGNHLRHRTSCYLNNRLEQDHRGIKSRYRPMLGLKR